MYQEYDYPFSLGRERNSSNHSNPSNNQEHLSSDVPGTISDLIYSFQIFIV